MKVSAAIPTPEPWPNSVPPDDAVRRRAVACAKSVLRSTAQKAGRAPARAHYMGAGWSDHACFAVQVGQNKVFAKASRTVSGVERAALHYEYKAAKWAHRARLGPEPLLWDRARSVLIMAWAAGGTLSAAAALQRLDEVVALMRRWHATPIEGWRAKPFDPLAQVRVQIDETLAQNVLAPHDAAALLQAVKCSEAGLGALPACTSVACHTDFHVQNIVVDSQGQLLLVDGEEAGLSDPMWDLACLVVNMRTIGQDPSLSCAAIAKLYGTTPAQQARLALHVQLSLASYAAWTALRGPAWQQQRQNAFCLLHGA